MVNQETLGKDKDLKQYITKNPRLKPSTSTLFATISIILVTIPAYFFVLWIFVNFKETAYPENVNLYDSYLPEFLRGRYTTSLVSVVCCALALALNVKNLESRNRRVKNFSILVVIIASLMGGLNLFSMM